MKKTLIVILTAGLMALFGCVTYLGKPNTPQEERVELKLDYGVLLHQLDESVLTFPLVGTVILNSGKHALFVRYSKTTTGGSWSTTYESKIVKIDYTFEKGKKYKMVADDSKYFWVRFLIIPVGSNKS
ncbi:MAG: hypothetical protein JXD23_13600 [Spirochaetales bacterium]|nr:hypothetical protein [Spirochaetales bacterium]